VLARNINPFQSPFRVSPVLLRLVTWASSGGLRFTHFGRISQDSSEALGRHLELAVSLVPEPEPASAADSENRPDQSRPEILRFHHNKLALAPLLTIERSSGIHKMSALDCTPGLMLAKVLVLVGEAF